MSVDLDNLKDEIQKYLEQLDLAIFHGYAGVSEQAAVYWDTRRHADFREFVHAAQKAGTRLMIFYDQQFKQEEIDEAFESLEDAPLGRDEKRQFETRMRELQKYEGFTGDIDLSFSYEGLTYIYHVQADWYRDWEELLDDLDMATSVPEEEEEEDDDSLPGGYFSTN